jgi:hypothetical protein
LSDSLVDKYDDNNWPDCVSAGTSEPMLALRPALSEFRAVLATRLDTRHFPIRAVSLSRIGFPAIRKANAVSRPFGLPKSSRANTRYLPRFVWDPSSSMTNRQ